MFALSMHSIVLKSVRGFINRPMGNGRGLLSPRMASLLSDAAVNGLIQRINENNDLGGLELSELVKFRIENEDFGYLVEDFASICGKFDDVYSYAQDEKVLKLSPNLNSRDERTEAMQRVNLELKERGIIMGWRDEYLPVVAAFSDEPVLLIERAAYGLFGFKGYGVHINGYVRNSETGVIDKLWVATRAKNKSTWPGMLDHIVAGGQPFGITPTNNMVKECEEEAGIPEEMARKAVSCGAVSYLSLDEQGNLKRDSLFCFDLELPSDFVPKPVDGEVESFQLMPIENVIDTLVEGGPTGYKPNCNLVVIDFLIRNGLIAPESPRYLELVAGLRDTSTCK